ncbi:MAG: PEGA domain-containing protein, partial [Candidatus Aminicenantaceae bacterium]
MKQKWFQSRTLVFSVISALILMTSAPAFPMYEEGKGGEDKGPVVRVKYMGKGISAAQEKNFTLLLEDGKRLLKEWMDYTAAIEKFKEAEKLATQNRQKSDVYYYLSLAYFASLEEQGTKDFTDTIQKLIEVDYYRQLDENECPPQYVAMYNDVKRDYGVLKVLSVPPGADVFFNDSKASEGKTPLTVGYKAGDVKVRVKKGGKQKKDELTVLAGQETSSPVYSLEGKSSLIYIIGGALVAGAAGAVLLLSGGEKEVVATTGSLSVNSSPVGAQIYMGKIAAEDTGQVTPYTFTDIAPGNYTVVLKLENYADYTETAAVTAGQTTTVNPSLAVHT